MDTVGALLERAEEVPFVYKGLVGIAVVAWVWNGQRNKVYHHSLVKEVPWIALFVDILLFAPCS
jgi:ABC-type transporter Mla maintaining outer membrane lipid asymmetry permease subunit MlaE